MTALQVARLKLDVVRYLARRATLRAMRRVLDWMESELRPADERQGKDGRPWLIRETLRLVLYWLARRG